MMNKKRLILWSLLLLLPVSTAKADHDLLSSVQDKIATFQQEATRIVYYRGNIVNISRMVISGGDVGSMFKQEFNNMKNNIKYTALSYVPNYNLSASGIVSYLQYGDFVTKGLRRAVKITYTRKDRINNDVTENQSYKMRMNRLMVHNVAAMYARAMIKRLNLQQENKAINEEEKKFDELMAKDNSSIEEYNREFKEVMDRANKRWNAALSAISDFENSSANIAMTQYVIDKSEADDEVSANEDGDDKVKGYMEYIPVDLGRAAGTIDRAINGDYTGAMQGAVGQFGTSTMQTITNTGVSVYNTGDYIAKGGSASGALQQLGGAAAGLGGGLNNSTVSTIGTITGATGSIVGNAENIGRSGGDVSNIINNVNNAFGTGYNTTTGVIEQGKNNQGNNTASGQGQSPTPTDGDNGGQK